MAFGQSPAADAEPAAAAPAAPPAPMPAAAQPPGADLPPPPPPRGAPPAAPQGNLVISAPPVPPPMQRAGYHVHDGFYLRLAAGVGGGHTSVSSDGAPNFGVGGAGLALNLWIGGTPWRGVALGGLLAYQGQNDGDTVVEGQKTGAGSSAGVLLLGPFLDAFPDPLRGLHFGGALGLAGVATKADSHVLKDNHNVKDYSGGGLGASAWVGYMGFVGPEYSMGGLLQLTGYASGESKNGVDRKASGYALSLSFTALYH